MGDVSLSWWITVVEIPLFVGVCWFFKQHINDVEKSIKELEQKQKRDAINMIESIASFRVDIAMNYASMPSLKDVENRLTAHLLRIEEKLSGGKNNV